MKKKTLIKKKKQNYNSFIESIAIASKQQHSMRSILKRHCKQMPKACAHSCGNVLPNRVSYGQNWVGELKHYHSCMLCKRRSQNSGHSCGNITTLGEGIQRCLRNFLQWNKAKVNIMATLPLCLLWTGTCWTRAPLWEPCIGGQGSNREPGYSGEMNSQWGVDQMSRVH